MTASAAFADHNTRSSGTRKPNFVVILADDMGYSDAGCFGGEINTPAIDGLAARGLRFTQAYSTARCGPSRSCLMTGYYAQQTASDLMTPGNIPEWTRFLPHYLKDLGYRSYHSGKWHLRFQPLAGAGFEHSYLLRDQDRFFTPSRHYFDDEPLPAVGKEDGYYATNAIADHAIGSLREHAREHSDEPFCLYLAFTAPHFPLQARPEDIREYQDRFREGWDVARERRHSRLLRMGVVNCDLPGLEPDVTPLWNTPDSELRESIGPGEVTHAVPWSTLTPEEKILQQTKMAIYAAMITRMDREIGRVVAQLQAMNAYEDTVILFLSDNGASSEQLIRADGHDVLAQPGSARTHLCLGPGWASAANAPFRLHKSWVHEGGISSPLIVHWPNGIRDSGNLRHTPCHFIDVLPTLIELGGGKPAVVHRGGAPPLAGKSLVPALMGDKAMERSPLYFHHAGNRALRSGDYKIVSAGPEGAWELYDLRSDRSECFNLAAAEPDRVRAMYTQWRDINEDFEQSRESAPSFPQDSQKLQPLD